MSRKSFQNFDIFYDKRIVYKDYAQQKFLKRREPAPPWQQAKYYMRHSIDQLHLSKQKQAQFESKGLTSVEDIAYFFPRRYIDFRKVSRVNDIQVGEFCALEGVVKEKWEGGGSSYTAKIEELKETRPGYKATFYVSWFGTSYYIDKLVTGNSYIFCGKTSVFRGNLYISTPLAFGQDKDKVCSIMPIYSKIQGMSADYMTRQINASIDFLRLNDKGGPKDLFASSLGLMPKYAAIREMHQPSDPQRYKHAAQRMDFEEIYDFYEDLSRKNMYLVGTQMERATSEETTRKAIAALPFPLTDDQTAVIDTIIREAKSGRRIHSIISGDVGCGKTMVAILSCVFMAENGCQSIVMAPTLVLARQHYQSFTAICDKLKITVGLLTTETKKKERKSLLKAFEAGDLDKLKSLCSQTGGLSSYFGTSNSDAVHKLVEEGDPKAIRVWNAMIYQINKWIGSMSTVLKGNVDGILLTGGLVRFPDMVKQIRECCEWIAPVTVYPGEFEQEAMAQGALRILRGEEKAMHYPGKPVWNGFDE